MSLKNFKAAMAQGMVSEMRKYLPGVTAKELFVIAIVASAIGYLLMNFCTGPVFRVYGGLLFVSGVVTSLVTFDPGE
ncbi:MAG: hypothetical protein NVS3B21_35040 [Acidimicrobiales bacterium]